MGTNLRARAGAFNRPRASVASLCREAQRRVALFRLGNRHERTVTIVRPGQAGVVVNDALRWHPRAGVPPLAISLTDIFGKGGVQGTR